MCMKILVTVCSAAGHKNYHQTHTENDIFIENL
jgi:hypothetical protein